MEAAIDSANSWDPDRSCSVITVIWALKSGVALRSGGTHMTSYNNQHGGLHVVLGSGRNEGGGVRGGG